MKITKKQLRKLIIEATYFPLDVEVDLPEILKTRKELSPEMKKKADAFTKMDLRQGTIFGGLPEDKPDLPMQNINIEPHPNDENDGYGNFANAGSPKDIAIDIEDAIISHLENYGFEVPMSDDPSDIYYALPEKQLYDYFVRNERVAREALDAVIDMSDMIFYKDARGMGTLVCTASF